jgi:putative Mg2+ transporter-C (MgtC) family protein
MGFSLNPHIIVDILLAYLFALPVGWERERHERSAGLRTFPLVCVASCVLVAVSINSGNKDAPSRVIQGLIAGLGFIGGGTILKTGQAVHGTATAASILVTAVIGICVATHLYDVALLLSVVSLLTLRLFQAWKHLEPGIHKWDPDSSK